MIVISSDLILSPIDAPYAGTPWIGYNNIVTASSLASTMAAVAGFPITKLADPSTASYWTGLTVSASEYISVAISSLNPVDYLAIARHNLVGYALSVEARSLGNSPPSAWFELVAPQIVADGSPLLFRWTPQVLTDVRLRIQAPASSILVIAVMYVGKLLVMERGIRVENDHVPINFGRMTNIVSGMSESGNFLGRVVVGSYRESKAEFAHITPVFYRQQIDPFILASKLYPFFWVWNPSEYPGEVGYAWMVNEPVPATSPVTRRVAIEFQMRGIA